MTQRTITEEIQELRAMRVPELAERYEELHGRTPRVKHRDWLWRRVAWKIQEQRYGGLSTTAKRRLDQLIGELDLPLTGGHTVRGKVNGSARRTNPIVGTTLTREWRGREILVTAVDGGWEHEGVVYRSLSAVASAVTGSHWNGRLFFGLTSRRRSKRPANEG